MHSAASRVARMATTQNPRRSTTPSTRCSPLVAPDMLNFELSFRPPYDWAALCAFLGARTLVYDDRPVARDVEGLCSLQTLVVRKADRDPGDRLGGLLA